MRSGDFPRKSPLFLFPYGDLIEKLRYLDEPKAEPDVLNYLHGVSGRENLKSLNTHTKLLASLNSLFPAWSALISLYTGAPRRGAMRRVPNK